MVDFQSHREIRQNPLASPINLSVSKIQEETVHLLVSANRFGAGSNPALGSGSNEIEQNQSFAVPSFDAVIVVMAALLPLADFAAYSMLSTIMPNN